jgi:hypothetical protein
MRIDVRQGDVLEALRGDADETYTACLCDPPYGLGFMGKDWDHGTPGVPYWAEALRVLKPGGVLLAFGGTRTFHRLACAIEDAGLEVFDCMMWLYGSGFPKSLDVSKAIDKEAGAEREVVGRMPVGWGGLHQNRNMNDDGWDKIGTAYPDGQPVTAPATLSAQGWEGYGTALKPAWEPIICARKPRRGTYAQTATEYGSGALNVDGCRIPTNGETIGRMTGAAILGGLGDGWDRPWKHDADALVARQDRADAAIDIANRVGRWPANLILDEAAAAALGSPARYFYTAKSSRGEREAGLEGMVTTQPAEVYGDGMNGATRFDPALHTLEGMAARASHRVHNPHPTVKPLALCEYLARLLVPPVEYRDEATLLVPFAGSGSEMIGAWQAGWRNIVGIELEAEYVAIAEKRIAHWCRQEVLA